MSAVLPAIPPLSNGVIVSRLEAYASHHPYRSLSVKYVVRGTETYTVNGQAYTLKSGEFLAANAASAGSLHIDQPVPADGICADIAPETMDEVCHYHLGLDPGTPLRMDFFRGDHFFERVFRDQFSHTGRHLQALARRCAPGNYLVQDLDPNFYYGLAEALLADYLPVATELIKTRKHQPAVRKELLRRLYRGKAFLDDNLCRRELIGEAAREACLSEFYFLRGFRDVFGQSPYQYVLELRLQAAKHWLNHTDEPVGAVAERFGYPDGSAFSKAFRKRFGQPPPKASEEKTIFDKHRRRTFPIFIKNYAGCLPC